MNLDRETLDQVNADAMAERRLADMRRDFPWLRHWWVRLVARLIRLIPRA